jgi:DUF4097 and DUF4098 domain-containing protein YvlB
MSNGRPQRSAFGPILLVIVGTLFLIHNFRPDLIRWAWLGTWWPALLILWGVIRLVENLSGSGRRGITGGEISLLLLLILIGIAISFASRIPGGIRVDLPEDVPFAESADMTEELPARDLAPGSVVRINTSRGDITVDGLSDEKQLRVVVRKTGYAMSEEEAHSKASGAKVNVQQTGKDVTLDAGGVSRKDGDVRVSFEVKVPRNVALDLRTQRGDVRASGVSGDVTASVTHGDVDVHDSGGEVRADVGRGDVRVTTAKGNVHVSGKGSEVEVDDVAGAATIDGEFYGPIVARNVARGARFVSSHTDLNIGGLPGRMDVESGEVRVQDAAGPLLLTTSDKSINLEDISGRIQVQNKRGDITVRLTAPPKEQIDLNNESGAVELALPTKSAFEMNATSRSGEIQNELNDSALQSTQQGGDSKLQGTVGAHGPKITLNTSYGPIRLKHSD